MTLRCYRKIRMSDERLDAIRRANAIIEEYQRQGMSMTLRQLYYQHVRRNLIANNEREYDKLGSLINDGRMAGLISWTAIEDRGRDLRGLRTYDSPGQAIRAAANGYRIDLWADQPMRPEVWIEKEALVGVIGGICNELRVDFFACKGYNSQSEQWRAGMRFQDYVRKGQTPIVFHLGDHDPSGIDMTRDNRERLSLFAGLPITVVRLALNMDQIEQYGPPPNPAKLSDSRAGAYVAEFGRESWELDALEPTVIRGLIKDAVLQCRREDLWDEALRLELSDKDTLQELAKEHGGKEGE